MENLENKTQIGAETAGKDGLFSKVGDFMKRDYQQTKDDFKSAGNYAARIGERGITKIKNYFARDQPELALAYAGNHARNMSPEQQREAIQNLTPEQYDAAKQMHGNMGKKGFTLIELLVVVAIISILAGMVLPVLAKARSNTLRTYCTNNLRQIGQAADMYAINCDGMLPCRDPTSMNSSGIIHDGMGAARHGLLYPQYTDNLLIFACPGNNFNNPVVLNKANATTFTSTWNNGAGNVRSGYEYRGQTFGDPAKDKNKAILMDYNSQFPTLGRGNHGGKYTHVLGSDGRVTGVEDPTFALANADVATRWLNADNSLSK